MRIFQEKNEENEDGIYLKSENFTKCKHIYSTIYRTLKCKSNYNIVLYLEMLLHVFWRLYLSNLFLGSI